VKHGKYEVPDDWINMNRETREYYIQSTLAQLRVLSQMRPRRTKVALALASLDMVSALGLDLSQFEIGPTALKRLAIHKLKS